MQYGIQSIGVKNFRSLKNINPIEIKPMTILVGENSCGKSSFLRILPLLKQSIERSIEDPIAFYGDYVDFGDFETVLNKCSREKKIEFSFGGCLHRKYLSKGKKENIVSELLYKLKLEIKKGKDRSVYVSNIDINLGKDIYLEIKINESKKITSLKINKKTYIPPKTLFAEYPNGSSCFLPFIVEEGCLADRWYSSQTRLDVKWHPQNDTIGKKFFSLDLFKFENNDFLRTFCASIDEKECDKLLDELIYSRIPELLYEINKEMFFSVENVSYAKPIRANTERYYRYQPKKTNEVLPDGSNLFYLLSSFTKKMNDDFRQWMGDNFDFSVRVNEDVLGSIIVTQKNGDEHNIIDMGYGFTQMLPLIVQLWLSTYKKGSDNFSHDVIFAIEQPELHLHPGLQNTLLRVFCQTIKLLRNNNFKVRFLLETHSKTFVMLLGELIEEGVLLSEEINILVFSNENGRESTVTQSRFNENGDLENWPIGFFG